MIIVRPHYVELLKTYRDLPLVKILVGIRDCGKCTILEMLREDLMANGIAADHIIHMRCFLEDFFRGDNDMPHKELYNSIKEQMTGEGRYYLLLDEVQEVNGWEKAIYSLLKEANTDIYVTGSNSRMTPGKLAACLTGQYISIPVSTLSFAEYMEFKKIKRRTPKELLAEYIRRGGFPIVAMNNFNEDVLYRIVTGIYTSILDNDIVPTGKITSWELFHRVVRYVTENVGKPFSEHDVVKLLKSEGHFLPAETVHSYLRWLEETFVLCRCRQYDLQEHTVLKQKKFYLADVSLKYCMTGFEPESISAMLENIVYLELRRRGYEVYTGKNGTKEIDFAAIRRDERIYVQVCRNWSEESECKVTNLLEIKDHYPKYVVTLDEFAAGNINGVKIVHLADFLLSSEY